jgi:hypothetical protein
MASEPLAGKRLVKVTDTIHKVAPYETPTKNNRSSTKGHIMATL